MTKQKSRHASSNKAARTGAAGLSVGPRSPSESLRSRITRESCRSRGSGVPIIPRGPRRSRVPIRSSRPKRSRHTGIPRRSRISVIPGGARRTGLTVWTGRTYRSRRPNLSGWPWLARGPVAALWALGPLRAWLAIGSSWAVGAIVAIWSGWPGLSVCPGRACGTRGPSGPRRADASGHRRRCRKLFRR